MSKESYIRGFSKAAEAAGIDPKALAKYAQQYKTDGWAPDGVSTNGVPYIFPAAFTPRNSGHKHKYGKIESAADLSDALINPREPYFEAMRTLDPRLNAWWGAHTNSVRGVADMVLPHFRDHLDRLRKAHPKLSNESVNEVAQALGF